MVDTTGAPAAERRADRLELRVPTSPTQLPAVRAMTGDLAMRMDFDLDAVEDLRLAVDEACAILAAIALRDVPLTVVFEATRDALRIDAWVPTATSSRAPRVSASSIAASSLVPSAGKTTASSPRSCTRSTPGARPSR